MARKTSVQEAQRLLRTNRMRTLLQQWRGAATRLHHQRKEQLKIAQRKQCRGGNVVRKPIRTSRTSLICFLNDADKPACYRQKAAPVQKAMLPRHRPAVAPKPIKSQQAVEYTCNAFAALECEFESDSDDSE